VFNFQLVRFDTTLLEDFKYLFAYTYNPSDKGFNRFGLLALTTIYTSILAFDSILNKYFIYNDNNFTVFVFISGFYYFTLLLFE